MAKQRNRDIRIWGDPWFRKLPLEYKLFWEYVCDNCDDSGVWKEDLELAAFQIGISEVNKLKAFEVINSGKVRLTEFRKGYYFIHGFIEFHYGVLKPTNNFHNHVLDLIEINGVEGLVRGSLGDKDKDTDKGKDKDILVLEKKSEKEPFGEDGLVMLTVSERDKLFATLGEKRANEYIDRLNNYIASKGKRYKSHYHTILNWVGNDGSKAPIDGHDGLTKAQRATLKGLEELNASRNTKQSDHVISGSISGGHV